MTIKNTWRNLDVECEVAGGDVPVVDDAGDCADPHDDKRTRERTVRAAATLRLQPEVGREFIATTF